jgi:hypothetical protein
MLLVEIKILEKRKRHEEKKENRAEHIRGDT